MQSTIECCVIVGLLCVPLSSSAGDAPRPNIIFIMADDLGYGDLGCYGQKLIATPNIDRLAAEGVRFTQAYAGGPVCTSSRAVLMTGLHAGHTPARDNVPHYATYLRDSDVTVAEVLKQAGYRCGGVGKWSLGDAGTQGRATNQGFDTWFGYLNQDHAHYYFTEYLDDDEGRFDLRGNAKSHRHYGHCRRRYDQSVRWKNWKGIRLGREGGIQLYDLSNDVAEEQDVAAQHPNVVQHIARIMRTAPTPSDRYPIGRIYKGEPLWRAEAHTRRTLRGRNSN